MSDAVNKPAHYNQGSIECIEAMKIVLTPEEFRGYLKGNVFKYLWREKDKNGIEDIRKGKSYFDRLIDLIDESEQQKADEIQSLKDHPFGKLKQPAWIPKVGEWVRIKKPADTQASATSWWPSMDKYNGQMIQVKEIDGDGVVQDGWGFVFDWLEPAEQPKATGEVAGEVAEEVNPPDGWRLLERGEVIRNGDMLLRNGILLALVPDMIGSSCYKDWMPIVRRNRFEVGEKVVEHLKGRICVVKEKIGVMENPFEYRVETLNTKREEYFFPYNLAPYIEATGEVAEEATQEVNPPDGWRWLEVGEILRRLDATFNSNGAIYELNQEKAGRTVTAHNVFIRRNRFDVGEKVVWVMDNTVWTVHQQKHEGTGCPSYVVRSGNLRWLLATAIRLAPYIEETK